ncbi:hypothetical protein [Streptomyces sp. NPDC020489]|uniref:hypothetical protein n=1 Tax=Streptomyces sp. NPDC020489 TaxID=3365077 RepID=UPI0037B8FA43
MIVWAVVVVVGGGLTWWLQDSAEPGGPYRWENADPTPSLPEGWEEQCGPVTPGADALCFVRTR